jgi:hypothetical protein
MTSETTKQCEICGTIFPKSSCRTCSKKCGYELRKKTRRTSHVPVEKQCRDCRELFLDTSKNKLVDRCRQCITDSMVATRRAKGSYERSKVQNEKTSSALRLKYESGWNPNTPEHRAKLSKGMKERWADGSMREKSITSTLEKWGVDHWTKSEKGRQFASKLHKGRVHKSSVRKNMSIGAARRIRENNNHYERGKSGYREDLGHYVRSNWEANFARILRFQDKDYEYEPRTFNLEDGKTYTPDFLVDGVFYEVKGYWTELARQKIESFKKQFPDVPMQIIEGPEYDELRSQYRDKILWEGK